MNKIKKLIKGFTLIEMIIVMAILAILMSALMNFYRPIRQTFVDSTMIEDMRTTQNGILTYLTESVRYAENLIIYDDGAKVVLNEGQPTSKTFNINSPKDAYEAFCEENSITSDESKRRIQIVVLNRSDGYTNTGKHVGARSVGFGGRIITNNLKTGDTDTPTASQFTDAAGERTKSTSGDSYMVLGGGYYGNSDYAIFIDKAKTWPDNKYPGEQGGITFAVQTAMTDETGIVKAGADYGGSTVMVSGGMVFLTSSQAANTMNCSSPKYYVSGKNNDLSVEDKCKVSSNLPAGSLSPTGNNIQNPTANTYIVILEPDEKR